MFKRPIALLCAIPALFAFVIILAPITTDPVALFGGISYDSRPNWLPGQSTIDPNKGYTSYALGVRAALDLVSFRLPLWNPYEGLGSPLLGEMQAAALFPPTLFLLLPHGQLIEQAFLQIVAGIGTFLFLRRFGLGVTAALAGGLLFEFNGVFAWLRNAIYNPVAFLPWLFYAVESLFAASLTGQNWRPRSVMIALGAVAAALAIYAGFPEVVFYYCLPLFGWVALRGASLPCRRALAYLGDLTLLGLAALLLAAPLLLAFSRFLSEGNVGGHQNEGFKDVVIGPGGMIMYLLPYIFGPIYFSPIQAVASFWDNGGYLGLVPLVLASGGALTFWRRPVVWLLSFWIVFAVGVTHGAPPLLAAFRHVPLVTISAFCRYLNAGWLFCAVTLAAMFIDRLPTMPPRHRRQAGLAATCLGALLLAGALTLAAPTLLTAWQPHQAQRAYIVASLLAALLLLSGMIAVLWQVRPTRVQTGLAGLATLEAIVLFAIPFASNPRAAELDIQLIEFLQQHAGLQRVAIASGSGLSPNYGSAFGIATINYDDLPVPDRTVAYVQRELVSEAVTIIFQPNAPSPHQTNAEHRTDFLNHLSGYERAGVRYVLTDAGFFSRELALTKPGTRPIPLAAGEAVTLSLSPSPDVTTITAVSVLIGTYGRSSDGRLALLLCQRARCQQASADLATAADNATLGFALMPPFALTDAPYQLTLFKQGGDHAVALWSSPPSEDETASASGLQAMQGVLPHIGFTGATMPRLVLQTPTSAVFELAGTRPYASAPGCRIDASSRERIIAECEQPSHLTRLELFMNGWTASVNGTAAPVTLAEDTFQAVDLPAGRSAIEFVYAPPGVRPTLWLAAATLAGLAIVTIRSKSGRNDA